MFPLKISAVFVINTYQRLLFPFKFKCLNGGSVVALKILRFFILKVSQHSFSAFFAIMKKGKLNYASKLLCASDSPIFKASTKQ